MTEDEVKKAIDQKNWGTFQLWMRGQTCGVNKDGSLDYYLQDVDAFKTKLKTGYDRQEDPLAWD